MISLVWLRDSCVILKAWLHLPIFTSLIAGSCSSDEVVDPDDECDANLALKWMTELSSSIYATPIIHDLYSDGHKEVIVPSFVHYLEVSSRCLYSYCLPAELCFIFPSVCPSGASQC